MSNNFTKLNLVTFSFVVRHILSAVPAFSFHHFFFYFLAGKDGRHGRDGELRQETLESTAAIHPCNGVFTELEFRLKFPQIQSSTGALLTSLILCIILM